MVYKDFYTLGEGLKKNIALPRASVPFLAKAHRSTEAFEARQL
jgi:hypothetical protein